MNYVVDFFCTRAKLVIEIDGEIHNQSFNKTYDSYRTQYLKSLGLKEIRFDNNLIMNSLDSVITMVKLSLPSPEVRRGKHKG